MREIHSSVGGILGQSQTKVQRIPQYDQYLSSLLEKTSKSSPAYADIHPVVDKVNNMVKERENEVKIAENQYKLEQVQERFPHDNLQLFDRDAAMVQKSKHLQARRRSAPSHVLRGTFSGKSKGTSLTEKSHQHEYNREYVVEGPVQLTTGVQAQDRYFFLFNDVLLIAKKTKSGTTFRLKQRVRVSELWTACCLDVVCESNKSTDKSFVLGWPTTNYVVTFPSAALRQLWSSMLDKHIKEERGKDEPKILNLKVINNDLNAYAYRKQIPVCNSDDTNEVIRLALEQFKINDCKPSDFQLWVQSGKEDALYPLIGHELPYAIQMNHLRDALHSSDSSIADLNSNIDNFADAISCQFILKMTRQAANRINLDVNSAQKRWKKSKKSSLINFKFRRSTSKNSDIVDGGTSSRLFGVPLNQLCVNGKLPYVISELLTHLYHNAPFLTGVFRKSANARVCRELREKLESDEEISFDDYSVLVTATVIKDFLRSLPDCVLCCNLYSSWLECNDIDNGTERIRRAKTIFEKLPDINQVLVKQFFCILHYIDCHSEENNMNAYNLSVCVGQSLLWPSNNKVSSTEAEKSKKVPILVEFLLENVTAIMGDDVLSLFGSAPVKGNKTRSRNDSGSGWDSDSTSNNSGYMRRDDESLDSLDRELSYNENNVHYSIYSNQLSPSTLSKDSEIHLSDSQLYTESDTTDTTDSGYDSKALTLSPIMHTSRKGLSMATQRRQADAISGHRERRQSEPFVTPPPVPQSANNRYSQDKLFYQSEPSKDSKPTPKRPMNLPEMRRKNILEFGTDLRLLNDAQILSPRFANDMIDGMNQPSQIVDSRYHHPTKSVPTSPTVQFTKFQIIGKPVDRPPVLRRSNSISSIIDINAEIDSDNRRKILSPQTARKFNNPYGLFYVGEDRSPTSRGPPPKYHSYHKTAATPRGKDIQNSAPQLHIRRVSPQLSPRESVMSERTAMSENSHSQPKMRRSVQRSSPVARPELTNKRTITPSRLVQKLSASDSENNDIVPPTVFFPSQATTSALSSSPNQQSNLRSAIRRSVSDPHDKPLFTAPPSYKEAMSRRGMLQSGSTLERGRRVQSTRPNVSVRTTPSDSRRTPGGLAQQSHRQYSNLSSPTEQLYDRNYLEENSERKPVQRSCSDTCNYDKRANTVFFVEDTNCDNEYIAQHFFAHQQTQYPTSGLSNTAKNSSPLSSDDDLSQSHSDESYV
ncbi:rho GTPase-activating protein 20-like isoform X2 [Ptychodera flava]|uniref:rho GTPase-activating protein 20-like isoform X2 n=1 Tax=Ptychodera flava TaxID=63121 RepID=UPI00396A0D73